MSLDDNNTAAAKALLDRASNGEHSEFFLITDWSQRAAVKRYYTANKKIARSFARDRAEILAAYLEKQKKGLDAFDLLLAYKKLEQVVDFYRAEAEVARDILDEYQSYLLDFNLLWTLAGMPRQERDMWDHRYEKPAD